MIVTGPGSAVGEKAKKLDRIGKISEKKTSRAVAWGGERAALPFPSSDFLSARFFRRYVPSFSPLQSSVPR